ncbi:hypothetical protein AB0B66_10625 [Catellatospora sp. NPDC049111]|uniref:hypothetical protein n=1 Tax=Catellatospora sp. NPDC049111 TaxID=3155271 RepID=UPI0033DC7482
MGTRGNVGAINPEGTVSVRYVHSDADMDYLPYAIASIWWNTFNRDTSATIAALLAHDWADLDPTTKPNSHTWAGDVPVAGVGMRIAAPLTDGPVTGRPDQIQAHGLMYLLDPTRPSELIISDGKGSDLTGAPAFDLNIGETVHIPQR